MKTILITGATSGIGSAIAHSLASADTHLILTGRNQQKLEDFKNKLPGEIEIHQVDLSSVEETNSFIDQVKLDNKNIDSMIFAASIWHGQDEVFANTDFDKFSQKIVLDTLNVTLTSHMLLVHGLLHLMPKKSKLVAISGTFSDGAKGWLPYFVAKRGLEDFMVGLSQDLVDKDIQVNVVSPSDTATQAYQKYFPEYMDEAIDPTEIAKQVGFLCSAKANDITGKVFVMKKGEDVFEGFHY